MKTYLIYDIETKRRVQKIGETGFPGEVFASSWGDRRGMGISVLCAKDFDTGEVRVYTEEDVTEFVKWANTYEYVVGYNILGFDNKMLEVFSEVPLSAKAVDLMLAIAGVNPDRGKRVKLSQVLEENNLPSKTLDGAHAPYLYQSGGFTKVINYCLEDVRLEEMLFRLIYTGFSIQVNGERVKVKLPGAL